jgi:C-terminal processing protease CtpA/Prc
MDPTLSGYIDRSLQRAFKECPAMRILFGSVLLVLAAQATAYCAGATDQELDASQTERLVKLCKVWGTVRYLHPYVAYKDIDWDAALVEVLPKVEAAKDEKDYRAAVQTMLDRLGDRATRVERTLPESQEEQPKVAGKEEKDRPLFNWVEEGVLAIHIASSSSFGKLTDSKIGDEFTKAKSAIFDLRGRKSIFGSFFVLSRLYPLLPSREVTAPAQRFLFHSGYRPQNGSTSGGYLSAFQTPLPEVFRAAPDGKGKRAVFLVDEQTELPPIALALQKAGQAFLVIQGELPDALGNLRRAVPLAEGYEVQVRTTELIGPNGLVQVHADAEVPADADRGLKGPAYQKALALLHDLPKPKQAAKATERGISPQRAWQPDKLYEKMAYPDREHRLLALFRFWTVIDLFYPYKSLLDQDWDSVLPRFLPKFAKAGDARDYALVVAEMATCIQDSHTSVTGSKELRRFFGESASPVVLRLIENKPVITEFLDEEPAKASGLAIGDVVVAVDGEPVEKRMARYGKYLAGSTPNAQAYSVLSRLLNGPDGSMLKLTIRDRDEKIRDVTIPRKFQYASLWPPLRVGPLRRDEAYKILDGNIGYCDLDRLTLGDVDVMLEHFKDTQAIIFDLRGYPQGTVWPLAARLNVNGAKYGAVYQRKLLSGGPGTDGIEEMDSTLNFFQAIPASDKWKYKGKTVTLIDERAISHSEYTGQYLEAACGTTFIGSPTAGTNGDVTNLSLPGGILVRFSGQGIRHVDGRQLQRIGIKPHIEVRPTLAGLRAGQDEVLMRALRFLREGK